MNLCKTTSVRAYFNSLIVLLNQSLIENGNGLSSLCEKDHKIKFGKLIHSILVNLQMSTANTTSLREQGLQDARNQNFMAKGYPPGPTKQDCKKMNFRDINTYMKLHEEFGDIYMLPLGDIPLVVTRDPQHIRSLLGGASTETFPRPPNVIANIKLLFGKPSQFLLFFKALTQRFPRSCTNCFGWTRTSGKQENVI